MHGKENYCRRRYTQKMSKWNDNKMRQQAPARIPHVPVLSLSSFRSGGPKPPSILDAGPAIHVTSGRVALAMALQASGVGPGHTVLVPAWHSQSMVPPVEWCGARPVFYRVLPDASPDLDDIALKSDDSCKAIMATHFFGFIRPLQELRAFCDARGMALIEDCAHAFFGPVGRWGDYAAASSMKFFPTYEGGCLVSSRHPLPSLAGGAGMGFEAKSALAALERSFDHGRLRGLQAALWAPMRLKDMAWRRIKAARPQPMALAPSSSDSSCHLDVAWIGKRSSGFSRTIIGLAGHGRIAQARRRHYALLDQTLSGLPGCRPLYPGLPADVVPWMYPLVVEDADVVAAAIGSAGLPLTRFGFPQWPGMESATCSNAAYLSRHVLAFPCHQELNQREVELLAERVRQCILSASARAAA
jgi:perosamine synthetase